MRANTQLEPSCRTIPRSGLTQPLPWISLVNLRWAASAFCTLFLNLLSWRLVPVSNFPLFPEYPSEKRVWRCRWSEIAEPVFLFPVNTQQSHTCITARSTEAAATLFFHYIWWVYPCMMIDCHCKTADSRKPNLLFSAVTLHSTAGEGSFHLLSLSVG